MIADIGIAATEQTALLNVQTTLIPWYWMVAIVVAPWLLGILAAIVQLRKWRMLNRAHGNRPIRPERLENYGLLIGAATGAFFQWGTQGLMVLLIGKTVIGWKGILVAAVASGWFTTAAYDWMRMWAQRKGWHRLDRWLAVKHRPEVDYTAADRTDITMPSDNEDDEPTEPGS